MKKTEPKPVKYAPRGVARRRISLRLSADLGDWLERAASRSRRSATAELEAIIAAAKKRGWPR